MSSRVFPTMRTSTDVRGRRSGGGGDRDGRLRIAALTNVRAVVRVLGSASLRADAVDRRRPPFRVGSIWDNMFRSMTSRPSRQSADLLTANARVCTLRMPCALTAILLPESLAHGCHMLQTWFPGRSSLDKVGRINPPLECSVWFHELPMCVRGPMRMTLSCSACTCVCLKLLSRFIKQS